MFFGRLIAICIITVSLQIPWFIFIIISVIEHLYGVEGYVFFFFYAYFFVWFHLQYVCLYNVSRQMLKMTCKNDMQSGRLCVFKISHVWQVVH